MPEINPLLVVLVGVGTIVAVHGLLTMRGKRAARPTVFEQPLIDALGLKKPAQVNRVLGRVRLIIGIFLVVAAVWAMRY